MGFRLECEGEGWESPAGTTPSEAARGAGLNPEAFVFIVDGMLYSGCLRWEDG